MSTVEAGARSHSPSWRGMLWLALLPLAMSCSSTPATRTTSTLPHLIIDTDAGTDDLIAIALIASDSSIVLDAVTVVDGLSSVEAGVESIRRLLGRLGHANVPVIPGSTARLQETKRFPADWRSVTESTALELLSPVTPVGGDQRADVYIASAMTRTDTTTRILALGPLTNIALALRRLPVSALPSTPLTVMGGALAVGGNLISFNDSSGLNRVAEWNVFSDPLAADVVFRSSLAVTLVPLDVTNTVPFRSCLIDALHIATTTLAGEFVLATLARVKDWVARGDYYAWDPLAAAVSIEAITSGKMTRRVRVMLDTPKSIGQTVADSSGSPLSIVEHVDAGEFYNWIWRRSVSNGGRTPASIPCTP